MRPPAAATRIIHLLALCCRPVMSVKKRPPLARTAHLLSQEFVAEALAHREKKENEFWYPYRYLSNDSDINKIVRFDTLRHPVGIARDSNGVNHIERYHSLFSADELEYIVSRSNNASLKEIHDPVTGRRVPLTGIEPVGWLGSPAGVYAETAAALARLQAGQSNIFGREVRNMQQPVSNHFERVVVNEPAPLPPPRMRATTTAQETPAALTQQQIAPGAPGSGVRGSLGGLLGGLFHSTTTHSPYNGPATAGNLSAPPPAGQWSSGIRAVEPPSIVSTAPPLGLLPPGHPQSPSAFVYPPAYAAMVAAHPNDPYAGAPRHLAFPRVIQTNAPSLLASTPNARAQPWQVSTALPNVYASLPAQPAQPWQAQSPANYHFV